MATSFAAGASLALERGYWEASPHSQPVWSSGKRAAGCRWLPGYTDRQPEREDLSGIRNTTEKHVFSKREENKTKGINLQSL